MGRQYDDVHILHLATVSGLPELLNKIFGRTYLPNQANPNWLVEGLAELYAIRVLVESGGMSEETRSRIMQALELVPNRR